MHATAGFDIYSLDLRLIIPYYSYPFQLEWNLYFVLLYNRCFELVNLILQDSQLRNCLSRFQDSAESSL